MKNHFSIYILLFFVILSACVSPPSIPNDVLPKEKMATILAEIHITQTYVSRLNFGSSDSTQVAYNTLEKELFKKQKIDTATYKRSFTFYSAQPEYMTEIYEDVLKKLEKKSADAVKERPKSRPTQ